MSQFIDTQWINLALRYKLFDPWEKNIQDISDLSCITDINILDGD